MIPQNTYQTTGVKTETRDFRLLDENMGGLCDGKEALMGWIACVLSTERYTYPIFSHEYGVEYDHRRVMSDAQIQNAIVLALEHDDRILGVRDFIITRKGESVSAAFTVESVYGEFETETDIYV